MAMLQRCSAAQLKVRDLHLNQTLVLFQNMTHRQLLSWTNYNSITTLLQGRKFLIITITGNTIDPPSSSCVWMFSVVVISGESLPIFTLSYIVLSLQRLNPRSQHIYCFENIRKNQRMKYWSSICLLLLYRVFGSVSNYFSEVAGDCK